MKKRIIHKYLFSLLLFLSVFLFSAKIFASSTGKTIENAITIGNEVKQVENKITKNRKSVYYKLEQLEKGELILDLKSYIKKTTILSLYNEREELISANKVKFNAEQGYSLNKLNISLEAGIYYIQVKNKKAVGKFNLSITQNKQIIEENQDNEDKEEDKNDANEEVPDETKENHSSLVSYHVGGTYKVDMENTTLLAALQESVPLQFEDGTTVLPQSYELYSENTAIINTTYCNDNSIRFSKSPLSGQYEPVTLNITYAHYTEESGFTYHVPVNLVITLEPM